jgi:hypothetical protein
VSLRKLEQDIQQLVALAHPEEKSALSEHATRKAFLGALNVAEFERKVREREPLAFNSTVSPAERLEIYLESPLVPRKKDDSGRTVVLTGAATRTRTRTQQNLMALIVLSGERTSREESASWRLLNKLLSNNSVIICMIS